MLLSLSLVVTFSFTDTTNSFQRLYHLWFWKTVPHIQLIPKIICKGCTTYMTKYVAYILLILPILFQGCTQQLTVCWGSLGTSGPSSLSWQSSLSVSDYFYSKVIVISEWLIVFQSHLFYCNEWLPFLQCKWLSPPKPILNRIKIFWRISNTNNFFIRLPHWALEVGGGEIVLHTKYKLASQFSFWSVALYSAEFGITISALCGYPPVEILKVHKRKALVFAQFRSKTIKTSSYGWKTVKGSKEKYFCQILIGYEGSIVKKPEGDMGEM